MTIRQFYHANQFIVKDNYGNTYLQSYDSTVARVDRNGTLTLGYDWAYSNTTLRHLYQFIKENVSDRYQYDNIFWCLDSYSSKKAVTDKAIKNKYIEVTEL